MTKWFLAFLGYTFFRFPGAILGYFLGSIFDNSAFKRTGKRNISSQDFELNLLA
jgi:DnaJ like chaperone protein